jgi:DNA-binding LytR/AlgR family response regulator
MTLKLFDEHLRGGDFLRIHNQYLVHGKYLSSFISGTNTVVLSNKQQIPVSRNRKAVLLDYLKSYMIQTS